MRRQGESTKEKVEEKFLLYEEAYTTNEIALLFQRGGNFYKQKETLHINNEVTHFDFKETTIQNISLTKRDMDAVIGN